MGNEEQGWKAPRKPHLTPSRLSMPGWFWVNPTLIRCNIKGALGEPGKQSQAWGHSLGAMREACRK